MGQTKDTNEISVRKSERKKLPEHRWKDNIKTELKETKKKLVIIFSWRKVAGIKRHNLIVRPFKSSSS